MTARSLPTNIAAMCTSGFFSLAWALEITPRSDLYIDSNGVGAASALRYCGTSKDQTIEGNLYTAIPGMSVSSIASTLGLEVDNCKATLGDNGDVQTADVLDGLWDGATYRLFLFNPLSPSDGIVPWHYGTTANVQPRLGAFDFELRDWRQALQQDTTRIHKYGCPYELGDSNCKKDLSAFTFAGVAVTTVTSSTQITCSGLAQAADYFTNGRAIFTSGLSANGISRQIRKHEAGGVLYFAQPLVLGVEVGDVMRIIAGCTHRPAEDCRDKFANKINYGGCDTKPLVNDLLVGALAS